MSTSTFTPSRRRARWAAVAGSLALAAAAAVGLAPGADAAPSTSTIAAGSLPTAPQSGSLGNGVDWTVDFGSPSPVQGYIVGPGQTQNWTFDAPVSLRFGVAGLNCPGEGLELPVGTVAESLAPGHTYDPATGLVRSPSTNDGDATSVFVIAGPVTGLTVTGNGAAGCGRGITFIDVSYDGPNVIIDNPQATFNYELGSAVPADFECVPGTAPIASCIGTTDDGANVDTGTIGPKVLSVTATDTNGMTSIGTLPYNVVDTVAPTVTITGPADGASYPPGSSLTANYGCTDLGGTTCSGSQANGSPINTTVPGTYSFTVTATDPSGNTTTKTISYTILRYNGGLIAHPVTAQVGPGLQVNLKFGATLTNQLGQPVSGQLLTFYVAGVPRCTAVTNAAGYASCGTLLQAVGGVLGLGYEASFGGNTVLAPASARGPIITVLGLRLF